MSRRILVVEDETDIMELIQFQLSHDGFEVAQATTAEEALAQLKQRRPDAMLLDLMLPDLDGISLCEIVRKNPLTASLPIMMVTAWTSEQARILGFEAGAADYIAKPFSPRELSLRLNRLLANEPPVAPA